MYELAWFAAGLVVSVAALLALGFWINRRRAPGSSIVARGGVVGAQIEVTRPRR